MKAVEKIRERIQELNITAYEIAKSTGLSAVGIQHILNGKTKNPSRKTLELIKGYIEKVEENPAHDPGDFSMEINRKLERILERLDQIGPIILQNSLSLDNLQDQITNLPKRVKEH